MKAFANTLSPKEIELVVDFVRKEFMEARAVNTRYHTIENGWPNHDQYAPAFPFALGEIAIDTKEEDLSPEQLTGKRIFMQSCVTCHDRGRVNDEGVIWDTKAVSYPRNQYSHRQSEREQQAEVDTVSAATTYAQHDKARTEHFILLDRSLAARIKNCLELSLKKSLRL